MVTSAAVKARFFCEAFETKLLDNTLRGLWCEFMIAEALGAECRPVGLGWHPWDLQIGDDRATVPERVRIQVKNSAALQSWNAVSGMVSRCGYDLTWRHRPAYFATYFPDLPCENSGFLCDLFILCHHPVIDQRLADHRDPEQWRFYLLPVTGPNCAVTDVELLALRTSLARTGKPSATQRRPETLTAGIRGRPPVAPLEIAGLSIAAIRRSIGL